MKLLDEDGNMRSSVTFLIGLLGGLLVFVPLYYSWHVIVVIPSFVLGMVLMGFSAYATQSATLDLRAFTNDPLGWRKAKKTYAESGEHKPREDKPANGKTE